MLVRGSVELKLGSAPLFSQPGGRPHDNYFMVDGINSNDPWMAQSMMNAVMAAGDAGTILAIDAIDEFKTQQNPGADYGWKPGAVVNVGVKSGSNTMHGSAYFYGRRGSWDARNFFETPDSPRAPLSLKQFGGGLGGPIKKDKLFYFLNFEQQRYDVGNPVQHKVPITAAFRAEFFNVLNHPNISNPFGGPGGDNSFTDPSAAAGSSFGFRPETPDVTSSNQCSGRVDRAPFSWA